MRIVNLKNASYHFLLEPAAIQESRKHESGAAIDAKFTGARND
jgi:hypothetical protein